MPTIPEKIYYIPLDYKVIAVAVTRVDGWAAYIGAVPGLSHGVEYRQVLQDGTKLDEQVARAIFGHRSEYGPSVNYAR